VKSSRANDEPKIILTLVNQLPESVELYWEGKHQRVSQGLLDGKGRDMEIKSDPGHVFTYDYRGERHFIVIPSEIDETQEFPKRVTRVLNGGKDEIDVLCSVSIKGGKFKGVPMRLIVRPSWAPLGASRFLQLVRTKYFDGMAIHRVVPNFLTQFGIGKDVKQRYHFSELNFSDDDDLGIKFHPGMISFAGNGPKSRSTEVFIAMPGVSEAQLKYWGAQPWERPFGYVTGNLEDTPLDFFASYGDLPPTGKGPDPQEMWKPTGYDYLAENFPEIDYIETCFLPWDNSAAPDGEL